MNACLLGSTESTKALVEHGADINAFDANRATALMLAAGNGHDECVRTLIEFGEDLTRCLWQFASGFSVCSPTSEVVCCAHRPGADFTPENYYGNTALQLAMLKQRVGCIRLLLAATNRARDKLGDSMIEAIYNQDRLTVRSVFVASSPQAAAPTMMGLFLRVFTLWWSLQVRNALHLGAYFDHKHTQTGEDAMDVAFKVGYLVNIELLRGAKRLQQDRTLAVSLADACKRGIVAQVKRIVELNKFDAQTRVPADGFWSLCTAAEYNQVECARYLVEEVSFWFLRRHDGSFCR
jgi:Ankyrin repeats (3 copies)